MKNNFLLILLVSFVGFSQKKKINEEYDYINNYYQFVYEAQYEYLKDNYQNAYDLLKKAESNCPLLNQTGIYEPNILIECSIKLGKKDEAFKYIELSLQKFGKKLNAFENDSLYNELKVLKKWKKLQRRESKYYINYKEKVNIPLRKKLFLMLNEDQKFRVNGFDREASEKVDSINNLKLKKIVSDCDCYPNYGINEIGDYNLDEFDPEISTLVFHINLINSEYWKPIFLDLIRRGRAPADIYANLIDSLKRSTGMFDYGIYSNVTNERINDVENLDKRRISVGLAPWQLHKDIHALIMKTYESE
jgi:hypothetical protein